MAPYEQFISIHTPHAGSDGAAANLGGASGTFQSTLPMRGVTYLWPEMVRVITISIHTPHAGSDYQ